MPDVQAPHPDPFAPTAVSDETRALVAAVEELLANAPSVLELQPAEARALREKRGRSARPPQVESAEIRTIPGPHGEVPLRVLRPRGASPEAGRAPARTGAYLFIHGGG
jgi:acetyl esterase/lipase